MRTRLILVAALLAVLAAPVWGQSVLILEPESGRMTPAIIPDGSGIAAPGTLVLDSRTGRVDTAGDRKAGPSGGGSGAITWQQGTGTWASYAQTWASI